MKRSEKNIRDMNNRSISVIGLGRSGVAIARLADYVGSKVFISDNSSSNLVIENLKSLRSRPSCFTMGLLVHNLGYNM